MKTQFFAAAAFAAVVTLPAVAQDSTQFDVLAEVSPHCVVDAAGDIALGDVRTANAYGTTQVTYTCNLPSWTRTISSANDGWLVNMSNTAIDRVSQPFNRVRYNTNHGTYNGYLTAGGVNAGPEAGTIGGGQYIQGRSEQFAAYVAGGQTLFAGNYADTVTITVDAS